MLLDISTICMDKTDFFYAIALAVLLLALYTLVFVYWINKLRNEKLELKERASKNFGRPTTLENAKDALHMSNHLDVFVITAFTQTSPEQNFKIGIGLLAHQNKLDKLVFVKMVFKTEEEICADGKTPYRIKPTLIVGGFYLEKKK